MTNSRGNSLCGLQGLQRDFPGQQIMVGGGRPTLAQGLYGFWGPTLGTSIRALPALFSYLLGKLLEDCLPPLVGYHRHLTKP